RRRKLQVSADGNIKDLTETWRATTTRGSVFVQPRVSLISYFTYDIWFPRRIERSGVFL
ncbi:hypothetical protein J6590_052822, partial [Homalodisca vitripennis]